MRNTRLIAVFLGLWSGSVMAQSPPVAEELPLIQGVEVSRPFQPSMIAKEPPAIPSVPEPVTAPTPAAEASAEEVLTRKGLPKSWGRNELLMWFPKAMPLPPLLVGSATGFLPQYGSPNAALLVGGKSIDTPMSTGGRFVWGDACDSDPNFGYEISYFFTGTRSATVAVDGRGRPVNLGRPIVDPATGQESFVFVSSPAAPGFFRATSVNRMTGWEVNGMWNIDTTPTAYLHFVGGYRYFLNHEGVRLEQTTIMSLDGGAQFVSNSADQIDGHTRFHGGQIGFEFGQDFQRFYIEGATKVAFGRSYEVVKIGGQTNLVTTSTAGKTYLPLPGGVLATSSNTGRVSYSAFAVLPEAQLRLGYRFTDRSRFYLGYNFIYLSDAVRAGDQIDRSVTMAQLVTGNSQAGVAVPGGLRPQLAMTRTDFWAQGLTLGFESHY